MAGKESDFPSRKERKNMVFPRDLSHPMMVLPTDEPVKRQPHVFPPKTINSVKRNFILRAVVETTPVGKH